MLSDVKRAYFHALAKRELYVELPPEDIGYQPGYVGRLRLALYGTRDAASLWQECLSQHLADIGFVRGKSNPCVFYNAERNIRTLLHGDDYASIGSVDALDWMRLELENKFDMKTTIVGHSRAKGVVAEGKILNRIIRAVNSGWEYECDQRHVEVLVEELCLAGAKSLSTPGVDEPSDNVPPDNVAVLPCSEGLAPKTHKSVRSLFRVVE